MNDHAVRISSDTTDEVHDVYELVILDYIDNTHPSQLCVEADYINPDEYFVTSGDAVEKTKVLLKDYKSLYESLKHRLDYEPSIEPYLISVLTNIISCDRLLQDLKKARGSKLFLETEWNNHHLYCIPKNPRAIA